MTRTRRNQLAQAAICLLCAIAVWRYTFFLEGSEFSGGGITSQLLKADDIGGVLFVLSIPLSFVRIRIAAAIALLASVVCLPIHLYFVALAPFRWIFKDEYSVPLHSNFTGDAWSIVDMVLLISAILISIRNLFSKANH
jgi:hypothetical protein